ncbi:MAG: type 1 glutamine amidotransferase [Nocardioidaceae bacterium]
MTSHRLLVVQHEAGCPPAWFGPWLEAAGCDLDVLRGDLGQPIPDTLAGYAGLMVLGGEMGAYDDVDHPWLTPTKELIATVVSADQPFLGICLGHQLAAVAMGGEVTRNPNGPATGLTPVTLTDAGRTDPLLNVVVDRAATIQWNNDIVARLPAGAVLLAVAPDGTVQAARFGARAWGVQFHPEASPAVVRDWTVGRPAATELESQGIDVTAARAAIEGAEEQLFADWQPLAHRFGRLVTESSTVP